MKKIFTISATLLLSVFCCTIIAQPALQWKRSFGGTGTDVANSIRQTSDGGYIIAGSTTSANGDVTSNHGDADYWIVRLGRTGNIVWQKTFGGSGTDVARCVQPTADGGYIVAGISISGDGDLAGIHGRGYTVRFPPVPNDDTLYFHSVPYEPWIVKLDAMGNITWSKCFHVTWSDYGITEFDNNYVNTIIQTKDGGYLMGGSEDPVSESWSGPNGVITKLTSTGEVEWDKSFYNDGDYYYDHGPNVVDLVETATGYAALVNGPYGTWVDGAGYVGGENTYVYTFNNAGVQLSNQKYGGAGNDFGTSIKQTTDEGFIIAGYSASTDGDLATAGNHGGNDFWLFKTNSSGAVAWSKCYGGSGEDIAKAVQQAADGSYYVAGYSLSNNGDVKDHIASPASTADFWVVKTNAAGSLLWSKSYGGTSTDAALALEKTYEGGFIAAGSSASSYSGVLNHGADDLQLFKFVECSSLLPPVVYNQNFCISTNPTAACITITKGSVVKWYDVSTGGASLASTTPLVTGTYYATQSTIGCESSRKAVRITVNTTPAAPVASAQSFCISSAPTIANLVSSGTALKWYTAAFTGVPLAAGTPLTTRTYFVSQTSTDGCESKRTAVSVTISSNCKTFTKRPAENIISEIIPASVVAYPNPARDAFNILVKGLPSETVVIQLTDAAGKIVLHKSYIPVSSMINDRITTNNLPGGLYFISCLLPGKTITTTVSVKR
jgi:Ig-like domain CHU_C associated/Secretion system C-terminal sorting domain